MMLLRTAIVCSAAFCLLSLPSAVHAYEPADVQQVQAAARKGLQLVQQAAANYPTHRDCFSCHHQTLPMLAMASAGHLDPAASDSLRGQAEFTHKSFQSKQASMHEGRGIGGRSMTVGYGLWSLEIADWPPDEVTEAMVAYLLKNQEADGHWKATSNRPPLEESDVTCTALAMVGVRKYASESQRSDVSERNARALKWLCTAPVESNEDRVMKLWGLYQFDPPGKLIKEAAEAVLAAQRLDGGWGGWSQLDSMESDAYATGQTMWALQATRVSCWEQAQRARAFLLKTQRDDGSWFVQTRSNPIQVYFDNGDPHGKSQFISTPATAWAVAALAGGLGYGQPAATNKPKQ
jgi:N-acyl-D-amino-acid deacylase